MAVEGSHLIIKPYETSEGFEIEIKDSQAREQINNVDSEVSIIKSDLAKNTASYKSLERKVDTLFDIGEEITHKFEEDTNTAYKKDVPSGTKLASVKQIGGKTIVWNQGIFDNLAKQSSNGIEIEVVNSKIKITVNDAQSNFQVNIGKINSIVGHKYLIRTDKYIPNGVEVYWASFYGIRGISNKKAFLDTFSNTAYAGEKSILLFVNKATENGTYEFCCDAFDLTQMFGAGNEPSTVEEFEAMFPLDYYEYNEGTLMSAPVNEVVEQGKNLFDEEWEIGSINKETGEEVINDNWWRSKNYIEVEPNDNYFINTVVYVSYYDNDKTFISTDNSGSSKYVTPENARYMRIYQALPYENTIVSKGNENIPYSPYHQTSNKIPQAILDLDGYGDSVSADVCNYVDWENKKYYKLVGSANLWELSKINNVNSIFIFDLTVFATNTGYNTANNIICNLYDETPNRIYSDQLKDLQICLSASSGTQLIIRDDRYTDVNTFKANLQEHGVKIYYELAEPVITDISDIIPEDFNPIEAEAGGTLTFKNSNGDGYRIPVPNTEEYIVKLSEVGGTTA